jgi:hypothetical protein
MRPTERIDLQTGEPPKAFDGHTPLSAAAVGLSPASGPARGCGPSHQELPCFVFIFHDPGSLNHLKPLIRFVEARGCRTDVTDVRAALQRSAGGLSGGGDGRAAAASSAAAAAVAAVGRAHAEHGGGGGGGCTFVFGCSSNRCERAGIAAARAHRKRGGDGDQGGHSEGGGRLRSCWIIQYVDPPGTTRRLDDLQVAPEEVADLYLLATQNAQTELETQVAALTLCSPALPRSAL